MLKSWKKKGNKKKFEKILKDIKKVKIQGARNIAIAGLRAYILFPTKQAKHRLVNARPTEPLLFHVLEKAHKRNYKEILHHFSETQNRINSLVLKIIKNNPVIFTHCHSTNVVNALIYSKKHGKKFEVYNTETRPLLQGRVTAKQLKKAGIKVTMFVDSALGIALSREQGTRKPDFVFLGADAILKDGVINKVGSEVISQIAKNNKTPVYIIADSWKYTNKYVPIEQRKLNEVWDKAPKNIKIKNPAFEFVHKKYIKAIVSELGTLTYDNFLKKVREK